MRARTLSVRLAEKELRDKRMLSGILQFQLDLIFETRFPRFLCAKSAKSRRVDYLNCVCEESVNYRT